jgi:hypothetical protein
MCGNAHAPTSRDRRSSPSQTPNKEPYPGRALRLLNVESCAWELFLPLVPMTDQTNAE